MATCPSCGHENPDEQKFCGECGAKLEATPVREERKVITALFCDLVGSTALGERLDAEDISLLLRSYQSICRQRIESHGGVVEKFIGDAVVGVFGVPLAHEDDPERAVRAAWRMTEDIGSSDLDIEVRIGVNTGEALVRLDVDPRSGEGFATGDTMNTAARLEAAAPVMGVAVGEATHRASAEAIVYEELPAISAKGKAEPVHAWRALHPTARIGTEERDRTPFVGRDLELSMLTQLFERARSRPATEFVTIVAEPGLGKSRLVRELARHVDRLSELVTWRKGRCLSYGDGISFWALGEIVKAQAGILETDDQATVSSKLDQVIAEPDPQTRTWIKDRLAPLVGLETTTEPPQRDEAFTAWRRFLEQIAEAGPTVLVIEDLHWADDAFVAFLEHLAERTAGLPLLVVVTARPEVEERHPSWPPGRRSTVLSLSPLSDEDLEALITQSLPEADPELTRIVLERAGGSPLYAEQLAAMLRERALPIAGGALDETLIPSSVQALIAARIDALPPEPKRMLMEASVVGKTFWSGAVAALGEHEDLETSLGELVRREFVRPVHPSTMEAQQEFGFWHALVRDVAYAELTKAERARMHELAAGWIERESRVRPSDAAEILAYHFERALRLCQGAGGPAQRPDLRAQAVRYLTLAGDRAKSLDLAQAESRYREALELAAEEGVPSGQLTLRYAEMLYQRGDQANARERFVEALQAIRLDGDPGLLGEALSGLYLVSAYTGDPDAASHLAEAIEVLEPLGPSPALARTLGLTAGNCQVNGAFEEAVRWADRTIEVAQAAASEEEAAAALGQRGVARCRMGDRGGIEDQSDALSTLERLGSWHLWLVSAYNFSSTLMIMEGPNAAAVFIRRGIAIAARRGLDVDELSSPLREALFPLGDWDEVILNAEAVMERALARGATFDLATARLSKARVLLMRGNVSDARELIELAHEDAHSLDSQSILDEALISRAIAAELEDNREELIRCLDEVLELRSSMGDATDVPTLIRLCLTIDERQEAEMIVADMRNVSLLEQCESMTARALVTEARSSLDNAAELFEEAARLWETFPDLLEQGVALLGQGRCLLGLSRPTEASPVLRHAREIFERLQAVPALAETDALLERATTLNS